jgi:hypothetical protein
MTKPAIRCLVDWDDDLFHCADARPGDALNRMHTGLSSDAGLVNLHWNYINKCIVNSATSVAYRQELTDYGIRQLRCVTGTNVAAGAWFGSINGSVFDFNVTNGAVYKVSFWFKADVAGVGFTFFMENAAGSQTFTSTTSWKRIDRTITMSTTTTAFKMYKTNSATNVTFDVTGFMIVAGSTAPNGFNVGDASNLYDNITQDVKVCTYSMGKSDYTQKVISEGEANLLLDNTSKRYSPEYASSPLFGKMDTRRRFTVDIQNTGGTYVRRFTGWAIRFAPTYGTTRTREMSMVCQQGKSLLDRIKYNQNHSGATTADVIIQEIVLKGYPSAATPLQVILNRARLNASYFVNPADIYSLQPGLSTIDSEGAEEWMDAPASQVIDSLITIDQGFPFIDRYGKVCYNNREKYLNPAYGVTSTAISLDSECVNAQYSYGANYANTVRVNYYPNTERVGTVWNSQGPIRLFGGRLSRKVVDVKFEYEEGKRMKVAAVNPFDGTADASTCVATSGGADTSTDVIATFELKGGGGKLTLFNSTPGVVHNVVITLKGTIVESYGGQLVTVEDTDGLLAGTIQTTVTSKLISEENDATNLADYMLSMSKQSVGQFSSIQMINESSTALDKLLTLELGSMLTLSETQTAHASKDYFVVGVNEEWRADSVLSTQLALAPIFRLPDIWVLGTSVLGTSTVLAY